MGFFLTEPERAWYSMFISLTQCVLHFLFFFQSKLFHSFKSESLQELSFVFAHSRPGLGCAAACKWAAACTDYQRQTGNWSRGEIADLFRFPDVVGLDTTDGGKGDRANTADANGGKSPPFGGGKRKGYFIDQAGTQPCKTGLLNFELGFVLTCCHDLNLGSGLYHFC